MSFILDILRDGFFAGIASIGFASISKLDVKVFWASAVAAALGHMTRFVLMTHFDFMLVTATAAGALVIGFSTLPLSKIAKSPAEGISFPALLPMVPGMYAYRAIQALVQCLFNSQENQFIHYLYLLRYNWITCITTMVVMVLGVTIPIFIFQKFSFRVTK